MSNATIESPVAASQLFFDWSEQAEVGSAPSAATKKSTARAAKSSAAVQRPQAATAQIAHADSRQQDSQQSVKRPVDQPTVVNQSASASVSAASMTRQSPVAAPTGHLTFTSDGRIARPVRIGSVMIKLLKRYGITDAEIAEGVASYARKHQQAWAS